jgi:hypothetical protein
MNSTEHLDHVALTNNSLLFPTLFKQAWGVFKKKWCALFTLALMPIIFLVSSSLLSLIFTLEEKFNLFKVFLISK